MRFLSLLLLALPTPALAQTRSAYDVDPTGWTDLMPAKGLEGWRRVPIPPDTSVVNKKVWNFDPAAKVIRCDLEGIKEMLLYEKEFSDGVFHGEWRFPKVAGKELGYNSGLYIRTPLDGKTWHQVQVAHLDKRPFVGDLFFDRMTSKEPVRVIVEGTGYKHAKAPGEWNTFEITTKGKNVRVWLNGYDVTTYNDLPLGRGCVGMQSEFFVIEFRNLKYRENN